MIIVLEGVDGAGKTTLGDELEKRHRGPCRRLHAKQLTEDPMIAYEWALRDYDRRDLQTLWILDRWHVGELVYGRLYRGRSLLSDPAAKHVEMFLESRGAYRLLVTDAIGVIRDRLEERGETFLAPEHVGLVWDWYRDYADKTDGWEIVESRKASAQAILKQAYLLQFRALNLASLQSYVGSPTPRFLVHSSHRHRANNLPDFQAALTPHFAHGKAHAIMEKLLPFERFGILSQDTDQIRDAWPHFGKPPVVALDREAHAACAIAGIRAWPIKSLEASDIMENTH